MAVGTRRMMPTMPTTDLAARINAAHALAIQYAGKAVEHAVAVGEMLTQAKAAAPHGRWLPWLRANVKFSERTAQGYMRLASRSGLVREMRNGVADLSVRDALYHLATPRKRAFFDEIASWSDKARRRPRLPVSEWTPADVKACADRIRAFDELMHRYGVCNGDCCCAVCNREGRLCEPRCNACAELPA